MCGIVGYAGAFLGPELLASLLESMRNRGPDGEGVHHDGNVHMGMRRLSVIDLNTGWQPLFSRDGSVVAFQNGEIYNYRELRADLEAAGWVFRTQSDTEVLAHGYSEWSMDGLLSRIDGMYAIAIHDRDSHEIHLARDRFGEKPLFYTSARGGFGYASTLLAASSFPWVSERIDPIALDRYLALHFVPGERTMLADVRQLLPGEQLTLNLDTFAVSRRRYYLPSLLTTRRADDEELATALERAIASRLIADVPIGVFLSGGLDSSVVAAVAARKGGNIATFSMGFGDTNVDESTHAEMVARHIGSRHTTFQFDQSSFAVLLPEVARVLDTPIGDQAVLPLYWLCREARKCATVVLSGEGADEVFAGYSYYQRFVTPGELGHRQSLRERLIGTLRRLQGTASGIFLDETHASVSGFPLLTTREERRRVAPGGVESIDTWERDLVRWLDATRDPLKRATAADIATWLPADLLVKFDRMAMAHSLEGRAPYLDPSVVELALNLPQGERMDMRRSKIALRRVAKRYLPNSILERPKQGFVLPMRRWIEQWFAAQGGGAEYLRASCPTSLDAEALTSIVEMDLRAGVDRERLLFALIMLIEWWRQFLNQRIALMRFVSGGNSGGPSCGANAAHALQ